ncbi:MAG: NAD-binding protein [Actinobacteria bacterium]|nr:NAD-binding protein [Actinomycetota bacterium]
MHVVIVGCGRVGSALAEELEGAGHSVVIIDKRTDALNRLSPDFTGQTLTGVGFDRSVLVEAGIERADAVAAVTSGDNSNILIARVARENFGIATVAWTSEQVLRRLQPHGEGTVEWLDPTARVSLVGHNIDAALAGKRYTDIEESAGWRLVAVSRMGSTSLPTADLVAQLGDVAYVAVADRKVEALL